MKFKNEADALDAQLAKLAHAIELIGNSQSKWEAEYGDVPLDSAIGHAVRDQAYITAALAETTAQVLMTLRDTLRALDD